MSTPIDIHDTNPHDVGAMPEERIEWHVDLEQDLVRLPDGT